MTLDESQDKRSHTVEGQACPSMEEGQVTMVKSLKTSMKSWRHTWTTKEGWIGDYVSLCSFNKIVTDDCH